MFYNVVLIDDQFLECKVAGEKLKTEELVIQPEYTVKGDYSIIRGRVWLSELYAVDAAGNTARLVESEGYDYEALEDYIEEKLKVGAYA